MNGLVYSLDDDCASTPVFWLGVAAGALALHGLALFCFTFTPSPPPADEEPVTVMLDESFLNSIAELPTPPETPTAKTNPPDPVKSALQPAAETIPVPQPKPPEAKPAALAKLDPPPAEAAPIPPKPAPKPDESSAKKDIAQKPKLHDIDLAPFAHAKIDTAFDENTKVTDQAPKDSYTSDRTSTAADHGPKNLKNGDPYLDQGQTNVIRFLGKRGEGNVTPIASEADSGSVKKEGAPLEGDGGAPRARDFSRSVKFVPVPVTQPQLEKPLVSGAGNANVETKPEKPPPPRPPEFSKERPALNAPKFSEPDPQTVDVGTRPVVPKPPEIRKVLEPEFSPPRPPPPSVNAKLAETPRPASVPREATPPEADPFKPDKGAELDDFVAELNGTRRTDAAGDGTTGSGPRMRKGEKGHEGNGTFKPGDDNAVSDVTTINLDSSASELGDPRFAKRFDAKTAYIKAFARRIDGKWKAELHARLRTRLIPGMVSIRVILRKDGKLMEASEAYRNRGIPDEYVSTAKHAVEDAADPSADPFPAALANRETIEYTFVFLYQ